MDYKKPYLTYVVVYSRYIMFKGSSHKIKDNSNACVSLPNWPFLLWYCFAG